MKYLYIIIIVLCGSLIYAVGFSIYEEQRFNEKCEEAGMIAVRSWRKDLYCVKGFR
jgi:hypothetical protein